MLSTFRNTYDLFHDMSHVYTIQAGNDYFTFLTLRRDIVSESALLQRGRFSYSCRPGRHIFAEAVPPDFAAPLSFTKRHFHCLLRRFSPYCRDFDTLFFHFSPSLLWLLSIVLIYLLHAG